jgi:hypothetical protein
MESGTGVVSPVENSAEYKGSFLPTIKNKSGNDCVDVVMVVVVDVAMMVVKVRYNILDK